MGEHQEFMQGILEYSQKHGPWTFLCGSETLTLSVLALKGWPGDGVIADVFTRREARAAARLGIPVVNLSGTLADAGLPRVTSDHQAIGRMAAEHLLSCGFRQFAYYGPMDIWFSTERGRGFAERIAQEGYPCATLLTYGISDSAKTWHFWQEELRRWLRPLTLPLAVMAASDLRARMVIDTCRQIGLHVPHDVAVAGVDNDAITCEASQPTLTSVARNGREIGYQAAQLLDRLMSGRKPGNREIVVAPVGIVARQSTDVVAVDDPELSLAVRFIHDHLDRSFRLADLLREVPVSRRWLEYRFRERFGLAPHEYICEARVELAKRMLLDAPRLRVEDIADACGFSGARNLRLVFRRQTGMTPAGYRRRTGLKPPRATSNRT
jgi:LacI family transcriptional regulator